METIGLRDYMQTPLVEVMDLKKYKIALTARPSRIYHDLSASDQTNPSDKASALNVLSDRPINPQARNYFTA